MSMAGLMGAIRATLPCLRIRVNTLVQANDFDFLTLPRIAKSSLRLPPPVQTLQAVPVMLGPQAQLLSQMRKRGRRQM